MKEVLAKVLAIVKSSLFMAALAGLCGLLLLLEGNDMYGGIAVGVGLMLFLKAVRGAA